MEFLSAVKSKIRKTFDLAASSSRSASPAEDPVESEEDQENQPSAARVTRSRRGTTASLTEIQNLIESPSQLKKRPGRASVVKKSSSASSTPSTRSTSPRKLRTRTSVAPSESGSVKKQSRPASVVKKPKSSEMSLPSSVVSSVSRAKRSARESPAVSKPKSASASATTSASKSKGKSRIKAEVKATKSGLYADISSSSGSEIDEGFDIDAALNPFDLSRTSSRKTGEWRRLQDEKDMQEKFEKEQKDPNVKSEWSATIEKHRNSTPLKQGLDDNENVVDKMTGREMFSISPASPTVANNLVKVNQSGSPLSRNSPSASPSAIESPLRLKKSIQGISSLRKQLAERSLAKQLLSGESTPTSSKITSTSSSASKKEQKDTPLRSLNLVDEKENNDTPRTRITRRTNALANEFNRLRDDASDGEQDSYVELQDVEIPVSADKYISDSDDSDEDKSKTVESTKKRAIKKGVSFKSYFQDLHDSRRLKTSNNTLEQLVELDYEEYRNLLESSVVDLNSKKKSELLTLYQHDYDQWKFELSAGFNLLFYGFGSKRRLLNELVQSKIDDGDLLLIHGFFPSLNFREILSSVLRDLVQHDGALGNATNQTNLIHDYFNSDSCKHKLYLVIHNIDGPQLRSEKIQASLAKLAQSKNIRIIASTDHINAFSMWDARLSSQFNFLCHDLTTFESYNTETSDETYTAWMSRFLRGSGATQVGGTSIRAALSVLNVITKHSRDIFRLLAEHQMENGSDNMQDTTDNNDEDASKSKWGNIGMPRNQLFQRARDKFIVSSDANFKVQMRELLDHRIVETFVLPDATEIVYTPFNTDALQQILSDLAI